MRADTNVLKSPNTTEESNTPNSIETKGQKTEVKKVSKPNAPANEEEMFMSLVISQVY